MACRGPRKVHLATAPTPRRTAPRRPPGPSSRGPGRSRRGICVRRPTAHRPTARSRPAPGRSARRRRRRATGAAATNRRPARCVPGVECRSADTRSISWSAGIGSVHISTNNAASTHRWRAWPMSRRCPSMQASTSPSSRNSTVTTYSLPQVIKRYGRIRSLDGS